MNELVVVEAGWATSIQDAGRPGHAELGVPVCGALDASLRAVLNRLVGNTEGAAVLETLGGLRVRPRRTGRSSRPPPSGRRGPSPPARPSPSIRPGGRCGVTSPCAAASTWEPCWGPRSEDSRSGLGPRPVTAGDRLAVGPDPGTAIVVDQAPARGSRRRGRRVAGATPRWFAPSALDQLTGSPYIVSADVSRVGVRLDGAPLTARVTTELQSEGLVTGAIQVPADGRPVVMLADHPTTGDYPVLAVVGSSTTCRSSSKPAPAPPSASASTGDPHPCPPSRTLHVCGQKLTADYVKS